jgi:hypothetical protein
MRGASATPRRPATTGNAARRGPPAAIAAAPPAAAEWRTFNPFLGIPPPRPASARRPDNMDVALRTLSSRQ